MRRPARPWTAEEIEWLTGNFTRFSNPELARKLDRSQTRVVSKLTALGLTSRDTPRPKQSSKRICAMRPKIMAAYGRESARSVAARFGISRNAVIGVWFRGRDRRAPMEAALTTTRTIPSVERTVVRADSSQSSFHQLRRVSVSLPRLKFLEAAE